MKRYLVVATLIVALATPSSAVAGTRHFKGSIAPSGGISFDARTRPGKVVRVLPGLAFSHVPMTCDGGARTVSGDYNFGMRVVRHHFHGTGIYTGGGKVTVSGEFTHRGRRADGTIKISGDFSAINATGCYARHGWRARKT